MSAASAIGSRRRAETQAIAVSAGGAVHEVEFRGQDKAHHMHNLILWHITR